MGSGVIGVKITRGNEYVSYMPVELDWTEEVPTKEGWYWAIPKIGGNYIAEGGYATEPLLVNWDGKVGQTIFTAETLDSADEFIYWLGPLPVPPLPVREVTG